MLKELLLPLISKLLKVPFRIMSTRREHQFISSLMNKSQNQDTENFKRL